MKCFVMTKFKYRARLVHIKNKLWELIFDKILVCCGSLSKVTKLPFQYFCKLTLQLLLVCFCNLYIVGSFRIIFQDFNSGIKVDFRHTNVQCLTDFWEWNTNRVSVHEAQQGAITCRNNWGFYFNWGPLFSSLKQ